jgi:pyruvate,orthophosphate dikinase
MGADHVWPRTEAMLQSAEDLRLLRKLIVTDKPYDLKALANQLKEVQKKYITEIYDNMHGRGVVIRLLDPPLHEFLPESLEAQKDLAQELGASYEDFIQRMQELREVNPMLGHRGVRLLISNPEIAKMQIRAILEATIEMISFGMEVQPEILIPMVADPREVMAIKQIIYTVHNEILESTGFNLEYRVGSMIETPRAAFLAAEIAQLVDFISFGTNDLTAFVYAFSRGDMYKKFLASYLREGTLDIDPFYTLDRTVAALVEKACQDARSANPSIRIDLCGEQSSTFR